MRDIRICFLGESFVNGTGDRTHLGWTGRLCADLSQRGGSVTYYNLGIRRETSGELRQRWLAECDRRLPTTCDGRVVFSFGTNDTTWENSACRVPEAESLAHARQILTIAQSRYPVLMISPPAVNDSAHNGRIQQLSRRLGELCTELGIPFLDVSVVLARSAIWMAEVAAGDGAHPDAGGYAEYANLIKNWSSWQNWF